MLLILKNLHHLINPLKKLNSDSQHFFPLYILISSFIFKLIFHLTIPLDFSYDETILTHISLQPLNILLHTIQAEPHGPLFYLLLKLFPISHPNLTRILIISLSYILIASCYLFALKNKLIQKLNLKWGLVLFFSSNTFILHTNFVKQDILTLPIALWVFTLAALYTTKPKKNHLLILSHLLSALILPASYIPYFTVFLFLFAITMFQKTKKLPWTLFFLQSLYCLIFLFLWGFHQINLNQDRFPWFSDMDNSLIQSLTIQITGSSVYGFPTDLAIIIFVLLTIVGIHKLRSKIDLHFQFFPFIYTFLLYLLLFYQLQFFVQARYSIFIFLVLCYFAGVGLSFLKKPPLLRFALISIFFVSGYNYLLHLNTTNTSQYYKLKKSLINHSQTRPFGFISDTHLFAFTFALNYLKNQTQIIPVHPTKPNIFLNQSNYTKDLLLLDAEIVNTSFKNLQHLLSQNHLENYFYLMSTDLSYSDNQKMVLQVLESSCATHQVILQGNSDLLFAYENCNFDSSSNQ